MKMRKGVIEVDIMANTNNVEINLTFDQVEAVKVAL
jgi:hypothetical protein